jgi:NH3-dependent NAD+ synthetase
LEECKTSEKRTTITVKKSTAARFQALSPKDQSADDFLNTLLETYVQKHETEMRAFMSKYSPPLTQQQVEEIVKESSRRFKEELEKKLSEDNAKQGS